MRPPDRLRPDQTRTDANAVEINPDAAFRATPVVLSKVRG
jgi:hypothetical protein